MSDVVVHDMDQRTDDWFRVRLGIPTASQYGKIVTAGGKRSESVQDYMDGLLADWLAGQQCDRIEATYWMERGTELENQARQLYSWTTGHTVEQVGFISRGLTGCSPDGLIGTDGMLEIKCPKASTLVGYYRDDKLPAKYVPQVQGQLWVAGRAWCDFFAWHPSLDAFMLRVERDEAYIDKLSEAVEAFIAKMLKQRAAMEAAGWRV